MNLEQRLWREINETLTTTLTTAKTTTTLPIKTLSSLHSLITNPSTTAATTTTVLQTLTTLLTLSLHPQTHQHTLSLLSTFSLHHPTIPLPADATTLLSSTSARLSAATLSLLVNTSGFDFSLIDDSVIVEICFRPCVKVRVWFIRNVLRFKIETSLLVTVLLGFSKDPYPIVREAAIVGLARVCEEDCVGNVDCDVIEACYFRAVELLFDQEDYVRQAAVRAAGEWGRKLASLKQDGLQRDWFDAVFLQLCSTVRDMNVRVRVEAFTSLGKFAFVSEDILLQALSKKVLVTVKEKQSLALCSARQYKIHAASAAGAFIHGLEDEFSEVQQAACITLRMLPVVSGQFAGEAVNIVSYVLNDDSIIVRLEALKILHHMVLSGCLKMQEDHIDMLLGTLMDSCLQIRSRAISIVASVKLPAPGLSKMTVESLLGCLDMYPKSEAEIFRALFCMGQNNGHHSVSIIEDFHHEIEPTGDEHFGRNNHRVAGLIILAVSTSLKHENYRCRIPKKIFSYAASFFGRISRAFGDTLDADSLLQYLSHCAQLDVCPAPKDQLHTPVHVLDAVKFILATVRSSWGLFKAGCTSEVLRTLRCCKGSLKILMSDSNESAGAVAFALQYTHIVKLLSKIWEHFGTFRVSALYQVGQLDILLAKLEKLLLGLIFRFTGLGEEDELYIFELLLLSHVLTLSSFHINCGIILKFGTTIAYVDNLRTAKSIVLSNFLNQLFDWASKDNKSFIGPSELKKLRDIFVLKDFKLTERIRQVSAELVVIGFDSVTPLRFIPGLPVGVPVKITLHNVTSDHALWLRLTLVDGLTQFVFLDMEEIGDLKELEQGEVELSLPFYRTPKSASFTLRVSIGIECKSENLHPLQGHGGPKHALTYISSELEVYFVHYE